MLNVPLRTPLYRRSLSRPVFSAVKKTFNGLLFQLLSVFKCVIRLIFIGFHSLRSTPTPLPSASRLLPFRELLQLLPPLGKFLAYFRLMISLAP